MGAVHYHPGPALKGLQPPRPADPPQSRAQGFVRDAHPPTAELSYRCHRYGGVDQLVPPQEGYPQLTRIARRVEPPHPEPLSRVVEVQPLPDPIASHQHEGGILLAGSGFDDFQGFGFLRGAHHRDPFLNNAGLLGGDGGQGVAQEVGVVEAQRGYHRDQRRYHVGSVKPTAESHLHHCDFHPFAGEVVEGEGGDYLEGGEARHLLHQRAEPFHPGGYLLLGYQLPRHPDALSKGVEVGRGVEAGAVSGGAQG